MNGERGTPVRRAALLLHAMGQADRDWVLGQLPASGRERLRDLLRELAELGIPRDATLLSQVVSAPAAVREPSLDVEALPAATPSGTIAAADPAHLAAVLRGEPVELVALLLSLREWAWRDAFLRQIGPVMARQVAERQAVARGRIGGAGEEALLAVLARRLRDLPAALPPEAAVRALPAPAAARNVTPGRGWLGQVLRLRAWGQAR